MDIIKKTVLQGFSISVLALAMVACGGSSDDSAPAATPTTPASLTTATDVAKAVAGIEASHTWRARWSPSGVRSETVLPQAEQNFMARGQGLGVSGAGRGNRTLTSD